MTWRELIEKLKAYPGNILDMDARVWINDGCKYYPGCVDIVGVSAYNDEKPVDAENELSLDLEEDGGESGWLTRDRDFYCIEKDRGQKYIHYTGCTYLHDNGDIVSNELTFCYVPVSEYSKERLDDEAIAVQQYSRYIDIGNALSFYDNYFSGKSSVYFPLKKVTERTPCGNYWCFVDDE